MKHKLKVDVCAITLKYILLDKKCKLSVRRQTVVVCVQQQSLEAFFAVGFYRVKIH